MLPEKKSEGNKDHLEVAPSWFLHFNIDVYKQQWICLQNLPTPKAQGKWRRQWERSWKSEDEGACYEHMYPRKSRRHIKKSYNHDSQTMIRGNITTVSMPKWKGQGSQGLTPAHPSRGKLVNLGMEKFWSQGKGTQTGCLVPKNDPWQHKDM